MKKKEHIPQEQIPVTITFTTANGEIAEGHVFGDPVLIQANGFLLPCAVTRHNAGRLNGVKEETYSLESPYYAVTELRSGGQISTNKDGGLHSTPEAAIKQAEINARLVTEEVYEEKMTTYYAKFPPGSRRQFIVTEDGRFLVPAPNKTEPLDTALAIALNLI